MANNIYHTSNWESPEKDGWGDVYFNPSATNKLYIRSDNYENSDGTDKALDKKPDTQSILMTPTAYNVGSMNSVLPRYEVLPTELVTNGDFATDSDWSKGTGWSIANGIASCDGTQTGGTQLTQTELTFTKNRTYKVVFTCTVQAGNLDARLQGSGATVTGNTITTSGTYTQYLVSTGNTSFRMRGNSDFVGTVDNVSVKEVISADFTFDRNSTATRVNKEGLIETVAIDTPRLDYPLIDGVVQDCPALLLEPSRTNNITYSEDFSQWQKLNSTVTSNNVTSPDGGVNADLINYDITSSNGYIRIAHTASSVISFYVKYKDIQWLMVYGSGLGAGKFIDIKNNIIGGNVGSGASAEITNVGNGWKRVVLKSSSSNITQTSIYAASSDGSYATITLSGGVYLWGAQIEAGSYATSYIPTSGSSVTRSAETCNSAGTSAEFNDSEGVLYAELLWTVTTSQIYLSLDDGSGNNRILIYSTDADEIKAQVRSATATVAQLDATNQNARDFSKVAVKYKQNDFALWINGFELSTDGLGATPTGLDNLAFVAGGGTIPFAGKTKEVAVFKEALTDSELEALTSWDSFNDMATSQEYTIR